MHFHAFSMKLLLYQNGSAQPFDIMKDQPVKAQGFRLAYFQVGRYLILEQICI